jgi:AraC-like DNA-binding protein
MVSRIFWIFQIKCCLVPEEDRGAWYIVADRPVTLRRVEFELLFGEEPSRAEYNRVNMERARTARAPVLAAREGFADVFAPVVRGGEVVGYLVTGPFLTRPPDSSAIASQWRALTGREARATDTEFALYLKTVFDELVLEGSILEDFLAFVRSLATVVAGDGDAAGELAHIEMLYERSFRRHIGNKMWCVAEGLVDKYLYAFWSGNLAQSDREDVGLEHLPTHVLAVVPCRDAAGADDPIADLARAYSVQRSCVELAHSLPDVICGRMGDRGVFFLASCDPKASRARSRLWLRGLADTAREHVRARCAMDVAAGVSAAATSVAGLSAAYDQATFALQTAVRDGRPIAFYDDEKGQSTAIDPYGKAKKMREAFANAATEEVGIVLEPLVRDVLRRAGGSLEALRAYFEALFGELVAIAENRAALEPKHVAALLAAFRRDIDEKRSLYDLPPVFRRAVLELSAVLREPGRGDRRSRIDRALAIMRGSLREADRTRVAKAVGLSPRYFSKILKQETGTTFEKHLLGLRLDRAKDLLCHTALAVKQVAAASGFGSYAYFFEAFKRGTTLTPEAYRQKARALEPRPEDRRPRSAPRRSPRNTATAGGRRLW